MVEGMRGRIGVAAGAVAWWVCLGAMAIEPASAARHTIDGTKAKVFNTFPGAFAALHDPADGSLYEGFSDLTGSDEFSFPVILDTGASGMVMSNFVQEFFPIPLTGETFDDIGVGGVETFDVTEATDLWLASINVGASGADDPGNYSPTPAPGPTFNFQARQSDPTIGGLITVVLDVVGMPVLRSSVMGVRPNEPPAFTYLLGGGIQYFDTELTPTLPTDLPAERTFRVPFEYVDFISDPTAPVSVEDNPVIPDVRIEDARLGPDGAIEATPFIIDTGGTVTLIGQDLAAAIGIDIATETPVTTIDLTGIGGATRTAFGYEVDHLVLPLADGDELAFSDVIVFVPEAGALPADLPGILGLNLFSPAFTEQDQFDIPLDMVESPFERWYFDGPGEQFVLVSAVPEPASLVLLGVGALVLSRRGVGRR